MNISEVQCSDPTSVKDGFIEVSNFKGRYVYGSLATYHCNPGFILWGNASRLCADDGEWTGNKQIILLKQNIPTGFLHVYNRSPSSMQPHHLWHAPRVFKRQVQLGQWIHLMEVDDQLYL